VSCDVHDLSTTPDRYHWRLPRTALLTEYGMRDRTADTKGSKWRCYVEYCGVAGLEPLPATESHLLSYIGWLAEQRDMKLRSVSHASLPGYLSTIRTTHLHVLGASLPP
jgi:hypothetical protein